MMMRRMVMVVVVWDRTRSRVDWWMRTGSREFERCKGTAVSAL